MQKQEVEGVCVHVGSHELHNSCTNSPTLLLLLIVVFSLLSIQNICHFSEVIPRAKVLRYQDIGSQYFQALLFPDTDRYTV